MNLITLFRKISPYVKPYRWLVVLTLILTIIGSFIAQINAVVLDRTVDAGRAMWCRLRPSTTTSGSVTRIMFGTE